MADYVGSNPERTDYYFIGFGLKDSNEVLSFAERLEEKYAVELCYKTSLLFCPSENLINEPIHRCKGFILFISAELFGNDIPSALYEEYCAAKRYGKPTGVISINTIHEDGIAPGNLKLWEMLKTEVIDLRSLSEEAALEQLAAVLGIEASKSSKGSVPASPCETDAFYEMLDSIIKSPADDGNDTHNNREDFEIDGNKLKKYISCKAKAVIPDGIHSIESGAFKLCDFVTEISLPETVERIGESAFKGCTSLSEINIPRKVKIIDSGTFAYCNSLLEMIIPHGVVKIDEFAFNGCINMVKAVIPDSVTELGKYAFSGCYALPEIAVPDRIAILSKGLFDHCKSLRKVTLPDSLKYICSLAFSCCESLEEITIPKGTAFIEKKAFFGCKKLKRITIPESVAEIGEEVFGKCESIEEVTIPGNVAKVGNGIFSNCTSLTSAVICSGVDLLGDDAFAECTALTSVIIPASVMEISPSAFNGCPNVVLYVTEGSYAHNYAVKSNMKFELI